MTSGAEADRIAELERDNSRLRLLLDQRDAPGELRHRLRSTLALLRAIIRRSAETSRDLPSYAAHLEDRLDAIGRAQAYADQYGAVSLRTLLSDELLQYGAFEADNLTLAGPDVQLHPRAGQTLALAIHELAVNAVEYGGLGARRCQIKVSWSVESAEHAPSLTFTWAEHGSAPPGEITHSGFGTEVLTRMLAHDLKADTEITFGPDGLRCRISLPLPRQVGQVVPS